MSLVIILLALVILLLLGGVLVSKVSIRNVYFYVVCLASLLMFIFGVVQAVGNTFDIIYPQQEPWIYEQFDLQVKENRITQEEANKRIELEFARRKAQDSKELAQNIALILIVVPIFLYHWRDVSKKPEELT